MSHSSRVPNQTPVPRTRAECPTTRPCPVDLCRHNLGLETERPGRPFGGRHPLPIVREKVESCALDVVDQNPEGVPMPEIGTLLEMTTERASQLGNRALVKLEVAHVLVDHAHQLQALLPAGSFVEAVVHRGGDNPWVVLATYVIAIDRAAQYHTKDSTGVDGAGLRSSRHQAAPKRDAGDEGRLSLTAEEHKKIGAIRDPLFPTGFARPTFRKGAR